MSPKRGRNNSVASVQVSYQEMVKKGHVAQTALALNGSMFYFGDCFRKAVSPDQLGNQDSFRESNQFSEIPWREGL